MTKMTKAAAAAAILILAAGTTSIAMAASAASDSQEFTSTASPTVTANADPSSTPLSGDATIDLGTEGGKRHGAKISEDDPDLEEGYMSDPIFPELDFNGTLDGDTFNGAVDVHADDADEPLERFVIQVKFNLLLDNGTSFPISYSAYERTNLGINNTQTVGVSFSIADHIDPWTQPGQTLTVDGEERTVTGVSKGITVSVHPTMGSTGFNGPKLNLTRG
jgi:hypothetical protein